MSLFFPFQYQYGMVIDAGSSHTSLYVYSWNVSTNGTGFVQQVYTKSTGGKIDKATQIPYPLSVTRYNFHARRFREGRGW